MKNQLQWSLDECGDWVAFEGGVRYRLTKHWLKGAWLVRTFEGVFGVSRYVTSPIQGLDAAKFHAQERSEARKVVAR